MTLAVCSGLPFDVVLGQDWLLPCRESRPHATFLLSAGPVCLGALSSPAIENVSMDIDDDGLASGAFSDSAFIVLFLWRIGFVPLPVDVFVHMSLVHVPVSPHAMTLIRE
ncbi:hypothetical protein GGX14DRAFT_453339, partial [Mycena pura]